MIFHFEHGTMPGSLELAYLGDTLYDLYVREHLVAGGGRVRSLHRKAVALVCAHAQSEALHRIEDGLSDAEADVVRRARNTRQTPPRHADAGEYHRDTALEALIGWLYVTGQQKRMDEILSAALPAEIFED
ncbi:MAG: ribonuclease III [Clostridia bacterium]|nr:ribonuclease III [Clostridia bacterium]